MWMFIELLRSWVVCLFSIGFCLLNFHSLKNSFKCLLTKMFGKYMYMYQEIIWRALKVNQRDMSNCKSML